MKSRLWVASVMGGLAAIIVLVVVVFAFGRHHPSPPSLEKHPNTAIPGEILFVDKDGCIIRAAASGASREKVHCAGPGVVVVAWVDAETIAFSNTGRAGTAKWFELDLETKNPRETDRVANLFPPATDLVSVNGERVFPGEEGEIWISKGGTSQKIADFDIPRYNGPTPLTWSPDGNWILLQYYKPRGDEQELWILSRDGGVKGTIATDVRGYGPAAASWWIDGIGYLPLLSELPTEKVPAPATPR